MRSSICRTLSFPSHFPQGFGSFTINSVFSLPSPFVLTGTFVQLFDYYLCSLYIWHDQNVFQAPEADHYFISLHLDMYLKDQPFLLWYYIGLGLVPSLSSGMWNYRLASQERQWQGSATPGCTLLHSKAQPLETAPEKYPLQGVDPRSYLICTPPCRRATPPGSPQFLVTGGYGPHPRRPIRTPVKGGYPRYHSILSPPRRASLLVPLPLELSASLPPEFCPLPFVCFLCGSWHRTFMRKHCQLEEFIKTIYRSSYFTVSAKNLGLV